MPTQFSVPFAPASLADWHAQVQKDLKDSHVYESLRWASPEGFTVEPYYTDTGIEPQQLAFLQAAQKSTPGWLNVPEYTVLPGSEKQLNATLRNALATGADALLLTIPRADSPSQSVGTQHPAGVSLPHLLDGIKLSDTPVFFRLGTGVDEPLFLHALQQVAPYQLRGGMLSASSTAHPAAGGSPITSLFDTIGRSNESPNFRVISISSHDFHTAGATATQELAFTLARLTETYSQLLQSGLTVDQLIPKTLLSVSVGTSYFIEMAKLRALRVLVARSYPATTSQAVLVHGQTSTFYEATATPYTNLLRATTEAMAAVLGGADALTVRPYDAVLAVPHPGTSSEFSERIARNVSTLLKAESYLDKVTDPAAGSYYIENLTHQLVEAAWTLYQQVQAMGGFTKAREAGYVQQALDRAYDAKVTAIRMGRVLVGVTKFRHDEAPPPPALTPIDTDEPTRRLSAEFE
ncbi:methylmalonyl-CoA mutase family protein [Fibrella arboris]|uniref:methylmalonyl-CoA mutase family protein n=1 Tax=Fibrella arboris TaxID=3242486 RepID=UPI003521AA2A